MGTNLYLLLGVNSNATPQEIKSAFRQRAKDFHPDHGGDEERFRSLQEAYETLSDPEARQVYDRKARPSRAKYRRTQAEPMRAPGGLSRRAFHPLNAAEEFETYRPSFSELFDRFWSNFDDLTRPKGEHIESLTVEVPISPEEAMSGGRVTVVLPARVECSGCGGRGAREGYECWRCEGRGSLTAQYPVQIAFPAGIPNEFVRQVPLDRFGILNFFLTVRLRVTQSG